MRLVRLLPLLFLFVVACATAATRDPDVVKFAKELDKLHADIEGDAKRFRSADNESMEQMRALETRMREAIAPIDHFSDLGDDAHAALLADQEELRTVLDRVDSERPHCVAQKKTGSNVRQMVCRSKKEEEMLRSDASRFLGKSRPCTGVQCGRQ